MPIGIFLFEIDSSFGPNVLADYYITKDKPSTEILKDFAEKHVKKDLADASGRDEKFRYYSSKIEGKDIKKNTFLGFMLRLEEDIVSLKSIFEKIEERVVTNFSQDKKKLQQCSKLFHQDPHGKAPYCFQLLFYPASLQTSLLYRDQC